MSTKLLTDTLSSINLGLMPSFDTYSSGITYEDSRPRLHLLQILGKSILKFVVYVLSPLSDPHGNTTRPLLSHFLRESPYPLLEKRVVKNGSPLFSQ